MTDNSADKAFIALLSALLSGVFVLVASYISPDSYEPLKAKLVSAEAGCKDVNSIPRKITNYQVICENGVAIYRRDY